MCCCIRTDIHEVKPRFEFTWDCSQWSLVPVNSYTSPPVKPFHTRINHNDWSKIMLKLLNYLNGFKNAIVIKHLITSIATIWFYLTKSIILESWLFNYYPEVCKQCFSDKVLLGNNIVKVKLRPNVDIVRGSVSHWL